MARFSDQRRVQSDDIGDREKLIQGSDAARIVEFWNLVVEIEDRNVEAAQPARDRFPIVPAPTRPTTLPGSSEGVCSPTRSHRPDLTD